MKVKFMKISTFSEALYGTLDLPVKIKEFIIILVSNILKNFYNKNR